MIPLVQPFRMLVKKSLLFMLFENNSKGNIKAFEDLWQLSGKFLLLENYKDLDMILILKK